jgi:hypothetical protein
MNREATLRSLDQLIPTGGAVALFGERYPEVPANAWHHDFERIIDSYSTEDPARPLIKASAQNEAVLLDSPFDHLERITVYEARSTPVERFVDRALSFAATWHGRPGSREDDLAVDIRRAIAKHADETDQVREVLEGHALIARRSKEL